MPSQKGVQPPDPVKKPGQLAHGVQRQLQAAKENQGEPDPVPDAPVVASSHPAADPARPAADPATAPKGPPVTPQPANPQSPQSTQPAKAQQPATGGSQTPS